MRWVKTCASNTALLCKRCKQKLSAKVKTLRCLPQLKSATPLLPNSRKHKTVLLLLKPSLKKSKARHGLVPRRQKLCRLPQRKLKTRRVKNAVKLFCVANLPNFKICQLSVLSVTHQHRWRKPYKTTPSACWECPEPRWSPLLTPRNAKKPRLLFNAMNVNWPKLLQLASAKSLLPGSTAAQPTQARMRLNCNNLYPASVWLLAKLARLCVKHVKHPASSLAQPLILNKAHRTRRVKPVLSNFVRLILILSPRMQSVWLRSKASWMPPKTVQNAKQLWKPSTNWQLTA